MPGHVRKLNVMGSSVSVMGILFEIESIATPLLLSRAQIEVFCVCVCVCSFECLRFWAKPFQESYCIRSTSHAAWRQPAQVRWCAHLKLG